MRRSPLALLPAFLLAAAPAAGQSSASSAETRAAQFVLVLDDSGSMRETDPNRLAVFAVQSLLAMLDDRDEVSLVRLNGAALGEEPPPIQPLSRGRKRLNDLLQGGVAAYSGKETSCRSALASTRRLLEQAHRPNVAQVVLFLTDGACAPAERETPDPQAFLAGLRSHEERLLQFYLLRFRGGEVSPQLPQLAQATGGDVIEVPAGDPTALLHGFAAALSRSQGYEAELVSPSDPEIAAHRGARRVRLLAVAPGESPGLGLAVHDLQGASSRSTGQPRNGVHRYAGGAPPVAGIQDRPGQPFRFVALDYRPDTSPMRVSVTGAGDDWKAVAVPEYRLFLKMDVLEGDCGAPGRPVAERGVETGSTVCLVADLVNEGGVTVDSGLTGRDLEAFVYLGGQPVPMVPTGEKARFRLQRNNLEKGDLVLQPVVRLNLSGGQQAELRGRSVPLQVSSMDIRPVLDSPAFGTLLPGQEATRNLRIDGTFKPTPLRISFRDRREIPSCVTAELDGQPEGKPVQATAGSTHTVTLRVAPYCGPRSFELKEPTTRLVLSFEGLSPREIPVSFQVIHEIQAPASVELKAKGGKDAEAALPLPGNRRKDARLIATLTGTTPESWPAKHLGLVLGGAAVGRPFTLRPDGGSLRLRAEADPCCAAGSYPATLELRPASSEGYAAGAEPPEPLVIPVRVEVESAGVWACWGFWIVRALLALLLLLAVLYVVNMFRNTRWLKPMRVAEKLVPLAWTAHGGTAPLKDHKARVQELVKGALPWHRRVLAWLQANPLAFGLPGGSYRETLELILQPQKDVFRSAAVLVPRRGIQEAVSRDPATFAGRLFAVAEGSVSFVCVPEKDGRIGRMSLDGAAPAQDPDPARRSSVRLRGHKLLRHPEDWESHEEGRAAGWQVG